MPHQMNGHENRENLYPHLAGHGDALAIANAAEGSAGQKTPVPIAPTIPPMPWIPKTSRLSS